jgi:hypothetical protein
MDREPYSEAAAFEGDFVDAAGFERVVARKAAMEINVAAPDLTNRPPDD